MDDPIDSACVCLAPTDPMRGKTVRNRFRVSPQKLDLVFLQRVWKEYKKLKNYPRNKQTTKTFTGSLMYHTAPPRP